MKKRSRISPYLFTGNSIRLRVKIFLLLIATVLITAGLVHFYDTINSNNALTKSYSQKVNYLNKYNETQKDFTFVINQFNNSLNCFQLQTNTDQSICNQHNNTYQLNSKPL